MYINLLYMTMVNVNQQGLSNHNPVANHDGLAVKYSNTKNVFVV